MSKGSRFMEMLQDLIGRPRRQAGGHSVKLRHHVRLAAQRRHGLRTFSLYLDSVGLETFTFTSDEQLLEGEKLGMDAILPRAGRTRLEGTVDWVEPATEGCLGRVRLASPEGMSVWSEFIANHEG